MYESIDFVLITDNKIYVDLLNSFVPTELANTYKNFKSVIELLFLHIATLLGTIPVYMT